jgi:DNA helicase-2/ATP-dependent DNA helicase PcrA
MVPECNPGEVRAQVGASVLAHDYDKGPLLLLAGPGTGKTWNLVETIRHQLPEYPMNAFLEVTLTNAAVDKFLEDARDRISPDFEGSSTLHFRAKGIVHRHAVLAGIRPDFVVVDRHFKDLVVRDLAVLLDTDISDVKAELLSYREATATCSATATSFSRAYNDAQSFYAALDWFDVVAVACRLLEENSEVLLAERSRFDFLLIDEYQDLNPSDQRLAELLLDRRSQLLVVGDDDQSIYSGRFADPSGIVDFKSRYPSAVVIPLPVTSRVPSGVLRPAYELISRNDNRHPKEEPVPLTEVDERAGGGFVISVNNKSGKAERQFIADSIIRLVTQGIPPKEILVLCSCKALGLELMESQPVVELQKAVPIRDALRKPFDLERDEYYIEQIGAFLASPGSNLPLRVILALLLGAKSDEASRIVKYAIERGQSLWLAIHEQNLLAELGPHASHIEALKEAAAEAIALSDPTDRLVAFLQALPCLGELAQRFSTQLAAPEPVSPSDKEQAVRFMTLHASKGLEADFVFIPFLEESLPLNAKDVEEERRLLFVGLSRAKAGVVLSWARTRHSGARYRCSAGKGGPFAQRRASPRITECGISTNFVGPGSTTPSAEAALNLLSHHARVVAAHSG